MTLKSLKSLRPIYRDISLGHLLNTARGWRAYYADDKSLGTFPDQSAAVQASACNSDRKARPAALKAGETIRGAAAKFDVNPSTVQRIKSPFAATAMAV